MSDGTDTIRWFPLQVSVRQESDGIKQLRRCPWSIAEEAFITYSGLYGKSQSLERIAERMGFSNAEMDDFRPGWREETEQAEREEKERTEND